MVCNINNHEISPNHSIQFYQHLDISHDRMRGNTIPLSIAGRQKSMNPKMQVKFCITGLEISPEEITRSIGITPTRTWLLGDSIQKTELRRKHNGWLLSTGKRVISLEESARYLLTVLLPKSKALNQLCSKYNLRCELSCAIYVIDEMPPVHFSKDVIADLSSLNTAVDVDIILTA